MAQGSLQGLLAQVTFIATVFLFPLVSFIMRSGLYFREVSYVSSLSSPFSAFRESLESLILTPNYKHQKPLQIILMWLIEWRLICLVLEIVLLWASIWNEMLRAVFCRVAEVFTVQADILLLHSMPEKRLVSTQHRVQACAAKVSVCFYSLENISAFFSW